MTGSDRGSRIGPFEFTEPPSTLREDFIVSDANSTAFGLVAGGDWQDGRLVLVGPSSSGKSHLASVWAREAGVPIVGARDLADMGFDDIPAAAGMAVDDADRVASRPDLEESLHHLLNHVFQSGGRMLLAAREPPANWPIRLPDLRSRLEAASLAVIGRPDDRLLTGILVKLFADRRVAVPPGVVEYVVPRMERSFAAAVRIVEGIDRRSLVEGRRISRRLAADVLNGMVE